MFGFRRLTVPVLQKYPEQCQVFQMAYKEEVGIDRVPDITFLYKVTYVFVLFPLFTPTHLLLSADTSGPLLPVMICTTYQAQQSKHNVR